MKPTLLYSLISLYIFIGCSQPEKNSTGIQAENKTTAEQEPRTKDTSYYFVKGLLNASPSEVEQILGKPDNKIKKSKDCDYLPSCDEANYRNGGFEILYYKNKLKWISINKVKGFWYDPSMIEAFNFPMKVPSVQNKIFIHWKNYEGIKLIGFFSKDENPNAVNYVLIQVDENYDKKFQIVDKQEMDNAVVEAKKQEKVDAINAVAHKDIIEKQFSSWDGSHINLTKAIKESMNDPSSFEHISTKYFDLGDHLKVVTEFRGNNSFGAKVKNTVIAQVGLDGHIIEMETAK